MKINISESHYLGNGDRSDKSDKSDARDTPKADSKKDGVRTLDGTFVPYSHILNLLKRGAK